MRSRSRRVVFALGLSLFLAGPGWAGPITGINGLEGLGTFDGTFTYTPTNAGSALLAITLHNTSPIANGGYLTAFVFNNPQDRITNASLTSSNPNFGLLGTSPFPSNGINAAPFGAFALGASTSSDFLGGGKPSGGIAVGDSATFEFALIGNQLNTLIAKDFFTALSTSTSEGKGAQAFVARFRGFNDGGSDKVPGSLGVDPPGGGGVTIANAPEPASSALVGAALCCLALRQGNRLRRTRRADAAG